MKLLYVSRDALALGLGAALVANRFVLDLRLIGWDTYPLIAAGQIDSAGDGLAPAGPTPPTPGVVQVDRVPLPSPVLQQQRDPC